MRTVKHCFYKSIKERYWESILIKQEKKLFILFWRNFDQIYSTRITAERGRESEREKKRNEYQRIGMRVYRSSSHPKEKEDRRFMYIAVD